MGLACSRWLELHLPLERLVFTNSLKEELLCVARFNFHTLNELDMMNSHIAFGSLAVSAFYAAIDLKNKTIGLTPKGDPAAEGTDNFCTAPVTCKSPMQTYYPP